MVYGCAAIFVVVEYEAGVDRELVDVDRLCPEKKWGLTSNDETIEAILLLIERGRREIRSFAIYNAVAKQSSFGYSDL